MKVIIFHLDTSYNKGGIFAKSENLLLHKKVNEQKVTITKHGNFISGCRKVKVTGHFSNQRRTLFYFQSRRTSVQKVKAAKEGNFLFFDLSGKWALGTEMDSEPKGETLVKEQRLNVTCDCRDFSNLSSFLWQVESSNQKTEIGQAQMRNFSD